MPNADPFAPRATAIPPKETAETLSYMLLHFLLFVNGKSTITPRTFRFSRESGNRERSKITNNTN